MRAYDGLDLAAPQIGIQTIPTTPEKAMSLDSDLKIPDIVYVKFQTRKREGDEYILGFMTPYDPNDAAFKDRKVTVDRWSEGWSKEGKNILNSASWVGVNESLTGFKILHTVSRSRTSNKVWRVLDPRGFELEISSWNLSELLQEVTLEEGVITSPCIWARSKNGENWLLAVGTDTYESAKEFTSVRSNRISLRDVDLGDVVTLHDGRHVRYLGGFYYASWDDNYNYYGSEAERHQTIGVRRKYAFLVQKDDGSETLGFKSSIKVGQMVQKASKPLTKDEAEELVISLNRGRRTYGVAEVLLSADKFTEEDLTTIHLSAADEALLTSNLGAQAPQLVYEEDGYLVCVSNPIRGEVFTTRYVEKEPLLKDLTLKHSVVYKDSSGWMGYNRGRRIAQWKQGKVTLEELKTKNVKVVEVVLGDKTYELERTR